MMLSAEYFANRKRFSAARPQGLIFANNPGDFLSDGRLAPEGTEFEDFIILSDDNRTPIDFKYERIEARERMVNGRMRSYHIADKLNISTSWDMLPSRGYAGTPFFDAEGNNSFRKREESALDGENRITLKREEYTTDGGAGGVEILKWYESNPGSFWVYLAYDKYSNFEEDAFSRLGQYNEVVEVFFSDFSYSVESRGQTNHDFWNISLSLEEV
jgi:hypothetical protein